MSVTRLRPDAIAVEVSGILPTDATTQIQVRLRSVLGKWADQSRVRLTRLSRVDALRPVVAQLDVTHAQGRLRAQVAAPTMHDAILMLATRSGAQLRHLSGAERDRSAPTPLATWYPELRPPQTRRLSRNKVCKLLPLTVDEAIRTLERMDYEFHLFREAASAQDSLIYRSGPGSFRLIQLAPHPAVRSSTRPLVVDRTPAVWRTVGEAISCLDLTGRPYEFFADKATGRGRVVYARYDGHYALLSAAAPLWQPN